MLYAIISEDIENSLPKRKLARSKHIARLEQLKQEGRLILAGPHPSIDSDEPGELGFSGSLVIAEFDKLTKAKEWANNDPYWISGVYKSVIVKPFKKVLP